MATVAVFPRVAAINAMNWEFPVPKWRARQVREVGRGVGVQGIDEQTHKSIDLISGLSIWGRTGVVLTTCSTKCLKEI